MNLDFPNTTKRSVLGEGSKLSKIAIIGEAPGADEERLGRPFVGAAGGLLDQCLHSAGIARSECYITNVVKERPKDNVIFPFYNPKKGFTKAGQEYVQLLKAELEECKANIFVAMGGVSLAALCNLSSITKWRGSILESTLLPGRKVLPCIHPAAALREYLYKYPIIADLKRAKAESFQPEIRRTQRQLIINPSFEEAIYYLELFSKEKKRLSFDIEVVNQELSCIGFAWSPTHAISIPLTKWNKDEEIKIVQEIARVLEDPEIPKLGQNLMFDISFLLRRNNIVTKGRIDDTMIGHHVVYYDFRKSLDFLCSIYAKEPYYKDEGKLWKNPNITNEQFWNYNAKDAAICYECWLPIEKEIDSKGVRDIYEFTLSLFPPLLYMQLRGIKADKTSLAKAKVEIAEKINKLQGELNIAVGHELNVNSSKQCQEYFYITKGLPPYTKTAIKDGRKVQSITTDDKAMTRLARKGIREAYYVQEIRGLRKLVSTYLDIEFDEDNRLRCSYDTAGTVTGRLSSSQTIFGTGANFQNIPPEFKGFLVADEGQILVELDKRQAEWVEVAYLARDPNMIEVVEKKLDGHIRTASLMFGAPEDLIKREDKIVGKTTDEFLIQRIREEQIPDILKYNPVRSMSLRQAGKKSNHSFNYGLTAEGFSLQYTIELPEARRCYASYHKAYPSIKMWHQNIQAQLSKNRTLTNFFNRKRVFMDRWGEGLFKAAYSYLPQSTVSDLLNRGIVLTYKNQEGCMKCIDLIGQVHDSVLFQYPLDKIGQLSDAVLKMKEYFEPIIEYSGIQHTIETDMKIGFNWADMIDVKIDQDVGVFTSRIKDAVIKIS